MEGFTSNTLHQRSLRLSLAALLSSVLYHFLFLFYQFSIYQASSYQVSGSRSCPSLQLPLFLHFYMHIGLLGGGYVLGVGMHEYTAYD